MPDLIKFNLTVEVTKDQAYWLEQHIDKNYKLVDATILPDTKNLYENDSNFKKLTKEYYALKKVRNDYINKHNFK